MKIKRIKSKRNLFMSSTLMCVFIIMTFKFDENNFNWMWTGQIHIPIILGLLSIILGVFWIVEHRKLRIKQSSV